MQVTQITQDGYQTIESSCPDMDRLNVFTGNLTKDINLFSIPTVGAPLSFDLCHNSLQVSPAGDLGIGWEHSAQCRLQRANSTDPLVKYIDASGRTTEFEKVGSDWVLKGDTSLFRKSVLTELGGGLWRLSQQPRGNAMEFIELSGSPIVARLTRILDQNDNELQYVYNLSGQLEQILDPVSGRYLAIGWSSGRIATVADPEGNTYQLTYTGDLLTSLEMPDGCMITHTYNAENRIESRTDRAGFSTVYTYTDGRLTQVEGVYDSEVLSSVSWEYPEDPVEETSAHWGYSNLQFTQRFFTDARGNQWEYRFLSNSHLWREINPKNHHRRFYYDDKQNLLYSSEGYFRKNLDDALYNGQFDGPRDNCNNQVRFHSWDFTGNLVNYVDANGMVTEYNYDANSRLTSVYPGRAFQGLGGDWRTHGFGQDGYVFCAHGDGASDWEKLPGYVASVNKGATVVETLVDTHQRQSVFMEQLIEAVNPEESHRRSSLRRLGFWTSDASRTFTFDVELNQQKAFNLSLYTHSADYMARHIHTETLADGEYDNEISGREIRFRVTDLRGTQEYTVYRNSNSVWVTFPVVGDEENPITVEAYCRQTMQKPSLAAITFEPFEDRRVFLEYDAAGNLIKMTQPTSDPDREISTEMSYNSDGTTSQVIQALRVAGVLTDSRTTSMFYLDGAKNLTRVEDPLNQDDAPLLMEYDLNNRPILITDQDGRNLELTYDYRGRVTSITNDLDHTTSMIYDGRGLLSSVEDPRGNLTEFLYTPHRRLFRILNALDQTVEYSYFPDGLLQSITDPAGNVVSFQYDELGQLTEVHYPETEVVLPNFDRTLLTAELRMAYDVWNRLVAVTSPNGNQSNLDNVNLVGALNILRNGGAERESSTQNDVPAAWGEVGYTNQLSSPNFVRSSAEKRTGNYSFPMAESLSAPSEGTFPSRDWIQRRPGGGPGGRYLMSGWARSNRQVDFQLIAVVRNHAGTLDLQYEPTRLPSDNTWTESRGRADMPGDAQVSPSMPVMYQFRAGIANTLSTAGISAFIDDLEVRSLSQLYQYDGENSTGSMGPDGAKVSMIRDRLGRVRRIVDPSFRTVDFRYDHLDRLVSVTDSQGLSLAYEFDFLGNLIRFTDSRDLDTVFHYDDLNRLTEIVQPGGVQNELFAYSPAGDLISYTSIAGLERQFTYDEAHRLIQIDYMLDPVESIVLEYDEANNLVSLTERNGDQLLTTFDELNRPIITERAAPSSGLPEWKLGHLYDSRGNRSGLTVNPGATIPRYGSGLQYGGGAEYDTTYFSADFNERNQMTSLSDRLHNQTQFAYDIDGRLAEVNHPTTGLRTRHSYDLVGKLLSTGVNLAEDSLWSLDYGYNLSGDRLSQHSVWADGGNSFRYRLDSSGRLVSETLNRFVVDHLEQWVAGEHCHTRFSEDGVLSLVSRDDNFASETLDLQRWQVALPRLATQVWIQPDESGLHWASSKGTTTRYGRTGPDGFPGGPAYMPYDYPSIITPTDAIGHLGGRMFMRHRLPLVGEFDLSVALSDYQIFQGSLGFGVTRERFQTTAAGSKYPEDNQAANVNGFDITVTWDDFTNANNPELLNVNCGGFTLASLPDKPTALRLKRYLDGSNWKLKAFYHDGTDWVTAPSDQWVFDFGDQTMYAYLHISRKVGFVRWTDFADTVGSQFLTSVVDSDESVNQATWPVYESMVHDAGFAADWLRLAWTETLPANTDVRLQIAVSSSPSGPWNYAGPSGANSYYSTAAGETLSGVAGRYARFRAFLVSTDGLSTPELSNVHLSHSGTSGSRQTTYEYDPAGNITRIDVISDAGTTTETRVHNDFNQLVSSSGPNGNWTYIYNDDGCLTQKFNGLTTGSEVWLYFWDSDLRLTRVTKSVFLSNAVPVARYGVTRYDESQYDFGSAELDEVLSVSYAYDQMGRMMRRDDGANVTTFVWDHWDLLSETTGEVTTDYLVPNGLIHSFIRDGERYDCTTDGLGSIRTVTDSEGEVVAQLEFSPWGEVLPGSFDNVPGGVPFLWVGGLGVRFDATTGMHYMRNRWFSPTIQRFISRDPIGLQGAVNLYAYVTNLPTNLVDPSGLKKEEGAVGWLVEMVHHKGLILVEKIHSIDDLVDMVGRGNDVLCNCKDIAKEVFKRFPKLQEYRNITLSARHHSRGSQTVPNRRPGRPWFKPKGHYHVAFGERTVHIFYSLIGGANAHAQALQSNLKGLKTVSGKLLVLAGGLVCKFANITSTLGTLDDVRRITQGERVWYVNEVSDPNLPPGYSGMMSPFGLHQWYNHYPRPVPSQIY